MLYSHCDAVFVFGVSVYGAHCSGDYRSREISLSLRARGDNQLVSVDCSADCTCWCEF